MEDVLLVRKSKGEKIPFSELLASPPSDDVLAELLPDPQNIGRPLVTQRELAVLKLRLDGFRQPEIAERLGLTTGQVAHASRMIKNCIHNHGVPSYIDVNVPSLRRLLDLPLRKSTGYTQLSSLLQDMPSDQKLLDLFVERGNIVRPGGKTPPTNRDLRLLQMRCQEQSYADIGRKVGMDTAEVRHQISLTLQKIRRDLRIELDVPVLHRGKRALSRENQAPACAGPKNEAS